MNEPGLMVVIDETTRWGVQRLAASSALHAMLGFLLGPRPRRLPGGGRELLIRRAVPACHTQATPGLPLWTEATLLEARSHNRRPETARADRLVGWFLSRPGCNVVLLPDDETLHRRLFGRRAGVGLVIDPILQTAAFYGWSDNRSALVRLNHFWRWVPRSGNPGEST